MIFSKDGMGLGFGGERKQSLKVGGLRVAGAAQRIPEVPGSGWRSSGKGRTVRWPQLSKRKPWGPPFKKSQRES